MTTVACRQPKDLVYQKVHHFGINKVGAQTVLSMDVQLYNPNAYKMKLKNADLDVYINNSRLGKINLDQKFPIPQLDTFSMPLTLNVDLGNALPNMFQLMLNSNVNVKLNGTVKAGRHGIFIKVPVNYEGKQDIRAGLSL